MRTGVVVKGEVSSEDEYVETARAGGSFCDVVFELLAFVEASLVFVVVVVVVIVFVVVVAIVAFVVLRLRSCWFLLFWAGATQTSRM